MYDKLLANLDAEHAIISVNERLSRFLITRKLELLSLQNQTILDIEVIFSANTFVNKLMDQVESLSQQTPKIISDVHSFSLWLDIIENNTPQALINSKDLTQEAVQTYKLMAQFSLQDEAFIAPLSFDVEHFLTWKKAYETTLSTHHWLDKSHSVAYLTEKVDLTTLKLPKHLSLVGFSDITKALAHFIQALQKAGTTITYFNEPAQKAKICVHAFANRTDELYETLKRAKAFTENNDKTAAIVIPDLQQHRSIIAEVADEVFVDDHAFFVGNDTPKHVAITGGMPLMDFPIIHKAFELLNAYRLNDQHAFSQIICTPFIGGSVGEQHARGILDNELKSQLPKRIPLPRYLNAISQKKNLPILNIIAKNIQKLAPAKNATPLNWKNFFLRTLEYWGWPGERSLSSEEHQAVKRFFELLELFTELGAQFKSISFTKALDIIDYILSSETFQMETKHITKVHILGLLEIGGLTFDHIWMLGLTDRCFPAAPKPNAFIPLGVQRAHNLPHCSSKREIDFASTLLLQLKAQTPLLTLSYPKSEDDLSTSISPLLHKFPKTEQLSTRPKFKVAQALEYIDDTHGSPPELSTLKGGSSIFKRQALCPFNAYASFCLKLKAWPSPVETLDFIDRGSLLHAILEHTWGYLRDQAALIKLSDHEIEKRITSIVTKTLSDYQAIQPTLLPMNLLGLEQKRLTKLVLAWLMHEKERPDFVVTGIEENVSVEFCDIPLKLRIDRIDTLASGQKIIIDYKTGRTSLSSWFKDRPTDPQLPLYALLTHAQGIAFAKINVTKCGFEGVTDGETKLNGMQALDTYRYTEYKSWIAQLNAWHENLEHLAGEFKEGYAAVDPLCEHLACTTCDFRRLCRVEHSH